MMDPCSIHSIIVRCPNWIGDAVMATATFQDLHSLFPSAKVMALAHTPIAELLQGIEGIDEWIIFSREKRVRRQEVSRVVREIRERKPDLGVLLTRSFSSAWMLWRAHIPWRLGFRDHGRSCLINMPVCLPKIHQHDVLTYRSLLSPLGEISSSPKLCLKVTEEEKASLQDFLRELGVPRNAKLLLINPGAAYGSAKCWPKESFLTVAQGMADRSLFPLFIGSGDNAIWINDMLAGTSFLSLAGKTTIRQLMALISQSACLLTNDSGPMHIATALNVPLLAIFGSTSPERTGPWQQGTVLYKQQPCSPCFLRSCPKDLRCMYSIVPEEVIFHLLKLVET